VFIVFEMSVSVRSLFTPDELSLELDWLKARDTLLGENYEKQDVKRALELASASQHPKCQWLASLFAEKTVTTAEGARDVFLSEEKKSPASLCFAALLVWDDALLLQSADLGYPFAQTKMARMIEEERLRFAKSAASQRERDGFFWLGHCYEFCFGCDKDLGKARECHLIAAQLGCVWSMSELGRLFDESDPQRWFWCGRAAVIGLADSFLDSFSGVVDKFNSGSGNGDVVFQIGKALNGHVSAERRELFSYGYMFDDLIGPASSAISFHKSQLAACRRAVDMWSHVGIRCGVVKDIRVLIGKLVWETRDLALYKV
jgi:TPR repeat protein